MLRDLANIRPTWVEINLDNLRHNLMEIRRIISPATKICAVVKADGYGHGAVEVAREALASGASYLAVAFLDEAMELRESGITAPILILGFTPEKQFDKIVEYNISQTVYSIESAATLSEYAIKRSKKAKVHIKIDTGMSRIGFCPESCTTDDLTQLFSLEGLEIEGIFTHFARADERDKSFTNQQYESFTKTVKAIEQEGFRIPIRHVANSAAILQYPETHLDMVRPGIILYGLAPSDEVPMSIIHLKPVMSFKTRVSHVKILPKGRAISYGGTYITQRRSVIATLPVGYADGFSRLLSSKTQVLIKGQRAPVVGRICMDQCMVDVTDVQGSVSIGDEVVLMGDDGGDKITAEEIARLMGTINYELVCGISKRVPRVYISGGKIQKVGKPLVK